MTLYGITVDELAIAHGLYDMFSEDDRVVMAFGMIPNHHIERLEKMLGEKFDAIALQQAADKYGFTLDELSKLANGKSVANREMRAKFVREVSGAVSRALYSVAVLVV